MSVAVLKKWGNSQGIIVPKEICKSVGLSVGDAMDVHVDRASGAIELIPTTQHFSRSKKLSAAEIFATWDKPYQAPDDLVGSNSVGNEADFGEPRGNEVW